MEILPGIEVIDLGLFLVSSKTLILSDFHMGYEEELNKRGVLVPRFQYKNVIDRLEQIFAKVKPELIVINGDLKHEFGTISKQEWKEVLKLLDYLEQKCSKIILVKGNHDTILGPIARKKNIKFVDELIVDDVLITHGHKMPEYLSGTIIIGHEHPAIGLKSDVRKEKYKCYLKGKYKRKNLIVQPSFNLLTEGTDVLTGELLSPFLQIDLKKFEVYVVDEQKKDILYFGPIKNL